MRVFDYGVGLSPCSLSLGNSLDMYIGERGGADCLVTGNKVINLR